MQNNEIKILAIETSCDETAAAVICAPLSFRAEPRNLLKNQKGFLHSPADSAGSVEMTERRDPVVLSNVISSQVDLHAKTGGVVPEVASRAHVESIIPVIVEALLQTNPNFKTLNPKPSSASSLAKATEDKKATEGRQIQNSKLKTQNGLEFDNLNLDIVSDLGFSASDLLQDVTHLAVTVGPGLIGSLLVGLNTAKALAYALGVPIVPVNHIEGHIYSAMGGGNPKFQILNPKQIQNHKSQIPNNNETIEPSYASSCAKATEDKKASAGRQLNNELKFPILALTVSGGHTSLTLMHDHGKYETIGQTLDDAAGEAFDKVAKLLDLGYPGGPALSRVAEQYRHKISRYKIQDTNKSQIINSKSQKDVIARNEAIYQKEIATPSHNGEWLAMTKSNETIKLPLPLKNDPSFNFSYSGLKTAVLLQLRKAEQVYQNEPDKLELFKQEMACEFEETAVAHLIDKTIKAAKKYRVNMVLLAGGVSANKYLREQLSLQLKTYDLRLLMPPSDLCGDNAAMIGVAAYYHIMRGDVSNWHEIKVDSNLKL